MVTHGEMSNFQRPQRLQGFPESFPVFDQEQEENSEFDARWEADYDYADYNYTLAQLSGAATDT